MPDSSSVDTESPPGVLCYDPNATTAKLTAAGLRLGGYSAFVAHTQEEAISLCKDLGPGAKGQIHALLLDASVDPKASGQVLRALVQLPGASSLPGILIVSRQNPTPIPGAEGLPVLRRPFSTPALVQVLARSLSPMKSSAGVPGAASETPARRLERLLRLHVPDLSLTADQLAGIAREFGEPVPELSATSAAELVGHIRVIQLHAVLEMLGSEGATGVLSVDRDAVRGRLHLDAGRIRLGETRGGDEDLKLGRFVVEGGFMRDEELEAFVVGRDPEGKPLGVRLVEGGFLSEADLARVIVAQAREVTCHLLSWPDGRFQFTPTTKLHPLAEMAARQSKTELLIAEALLDGLRRASERLAMGPHFAGVEDVFVRHDEQMARIGRHGFSREELAVLELLNGRSSVKDVARKTRMGTFFVAQVLYRLQKANVVRRRVLPVVV